MVTETQGQKVTESQQCLVCLFLHSSLYIEKDNTPSLHTIVLHSNTYLYALVHTFIVLYINILRFSTMIFFSSILFNFHIQISFIHSN